jgi:hypothetical protein
MFKLWNDIEVPYECDRYACRQTVLDADSLVRRLTIPEEGFIRK